MTSAQQAFMWRKWHFGRLTSHWAGRNLNDLVIVVNALWTVGEFTKIWPNKIPCSPRCLLSIVLGHLNNCGLFKITHKNVPHPSLSDYLTCTKKFQSQYDFIFFNLSNQKPCWLPISFFLSLLQGFSCCYNDLILDLLTLEFLFKFSPEESTCPLCKEWFSSQTLLYSMMLRHKTLTLMMYSITYVN